MIPVETIDAVLETTVADIMRDVARDLVLPVFTPGRSIAAEYKADDEAVTAIDRECEAILTERLGRLLPGLAIVGEEAVHTDTSLLRHLEHGACWIIDPLDGTGNYAAGTGPFGILVALANDGIPCAGWILDPLTGRMCTASRGRGARVNGEPFRVASPPRDRPRVALTRLFRDETARAALVAGLESANEVVAAPRCAADVYPRVAMGDVDAALFTRTIAWDHAAGIVFLNEAGGRAARPDGQAYVCHDPCGGLIAATDPARFAALADRVAGMGASLVYPPH